jgi:hypothetical protein
MEIQGFTDAHQRVVEVHVNMGRELCIYQRYPELRDTSWDSSIAFLPLTVLQDILTFCEECQQKPKETTNNTKITEYSIALLQGDMEVKACFNLQGFVSIKNSFPDVDNSTFRSHISNMLLATLKEAVAFGKTCEQEFLGMLERAKAKEALPGVADPHASQDETQAL